MKYALWHEAELDGMKLVPSLLRVSVGALSLVVLMLSACAISSEDAFKRDCPPSPDGKTIEIKVDWEGVITWNGRELKDDKALKRCLEELKANNPKADLRIALSRNAFRRTVAAILKDIQTVLGLRKIGFAGSELYKDPSNPQK